MTKPPTVTVLTITLSFMGQLSIWLSNLVAQEWVNITLESGSAPLARRNAAAIYDPDGRRMIVFAGEAASGELNDIWAFDLSSHLWTDITPLSGAAPAARFTPNVVYDAPNHDMLMWSGQGVAFFNDIWAFDLTEHTWRQYHPDDPKPEIRYGAASIFDPGSSSLITFAGFTDQGRFDDTWQFEPALVVWTDVTPSELSPGRRCLHSASYDSRENRMIIYGGQRSGALDDIWAFELEENRWVNLTPSQRPPGRYFATQIYDARNHRAIIFGGNLGNGNRSNALWTFDLTIGTWQELFPSGGPPQARDGAVGIYVETEDRMIVFGGLGNGYLDDVWSLQRLSGVTSVPNLPGTPVPVNIVLHQNSPNPFNPSTTIAYQLTAPSHVILKVFTLRGREVKRLVDETQAEGFRAVVWDGRDDSGRAVSSGLYVYRLRAGNQNVSKKMLLLK